MPEYSIGGQGNQVEILVDGKFPWKQRKKRTLALADVYAAAGMDKEAGKAEWCSTFLIYNAMFDGKKQLRKANFCNLRLCPLCSARRAKKAASRLSRVLDANDAVNPDCQYLFLTLTMKNVGFGELSRALDLLSTAWKKLLQHRRVKRVVKGWFRAFEITFDANTGFHPHIHAIICVTPDYFPKKNGLYLTQGEWVAHWQQALGVAYKPIVGIQKTCENKGKSKQMAAVKEAAKYSVKDAEYINGNLTLQQAAAVVSEYTAALYKRRLMAFGGWLKQAAALLGVEDLAAGSLVHLDDERVRDDIAELIETYHWSFGQGDYLLFKRELSDNVTLSDDGAVVAVSSDSTLGAERPGST